jgi:hypothetical protein
LSDADVEDMEDEGEATGLLGGREVDASGFTTGLQVRLRGEQTEDALRCIGW